jgi:predicted GIY-YIG superfamily endonuclease
MSNATDGAASVKYVYILESESGEHFYVGVTDDLDARLKTHNAGRVRHTAKYKPWKLRTYIAFVDDDRAFAFERFLKSASGRAFAAKRF